MNEKIFANKSTALKFAANNNGIIKTYKVIGFDDVLVYKVVW